MTEIMLSDDLINQLEVTSGDKLPSDASRQEIKFDAKGTLHMMCRNDDGKLIKDYPVKNTPENIITPSYYNEVKSDYNKQHEEFLKQNRKSNTILSILVITLGLLAVGAFYMLYKLN